MHQKLIPEPFLMLLNNPKQPLHARNSFINPYCIRMYSYVIRVSLVYTRMYSYVTRMSSVCHSYVLVCHPYVTRMYSYVIRISLVCGFTMNRNSPTSCKNQRKQKKQLTQFQLRSTMKSKSHS